MKVASFHVRASAEQSRRWKQAAEAEGHASAGTWLAYAADAYLKVRAKAGLPLPLAWRKGRFRVLLLDGPEIEVRGWIAPPFGLFHGSTAGPIPHGSTQLYTLAHLSTKRTVATFRTARSCKSLASELAPLLIRDEQAGASVVDRHVRESV